MISISYIVRESYQLITKLGIFEKKLKGKDNLQVRVEVNDVPDIFFVN